MSIESLILKGISNKTQEISTSFYGDHALDAISGAGKTHNPRLALVFINPTHRNISTSKNWSGLKAPWIGCANIWELFYESGLIDEAVNQEIQKARTSWSEKFAEDVYTHVRDKGLYITNIVKWAGLDAKLPERQKINLYAPLLIEELRLVKPQKIIAFGQLTFDGLLRELRIKPVPPFGVLNENSLITQKVSFVESSVGSIIPCYFPVGQGIKNKSKAIDILRMAYSG